MTVDLRAQRYDRGLSLDDAAVGIGVGRGTLERAEKGSRLHPRTAKLIADYYGIKVSDFYDLAPTDFIEDFEPVNSS